MSKNNLKKIAYTLLSDFFSLSIIVALSLMVSPLYSEAVPNMINTRQSQKITNIVIFPLNNLAGDFNAQEIIVPILEASIIRKGFKVIPYKEIDRFLLKRRIRNTSTLNSSTAIEIRRELNADAVLIGSIDFYDDRQSADDLSSLKKEVIAGLTLRLISTNDCAIIWMDTLSLAGADFTGILGVGRIYSAEKLIKKIVSKMIDDVPNIYEFDALAPKFYELESIKVNPLEVAGRGKVQILTRLVQVKEKPEKVSVLFNGKLTELRNKQNSDYYLGEFEAPEEDGVYSLDITASGVAGKVTFSSVAEVNVDNIPPKINIITNQDFAGGGDYKRETIILSLTSMEAIARWEIHILDKDNKTVRWGKGFGAIPNQVLWRGEDDYGRKNRDGIYKFQLSVWDEADNRAVYTKEIRLDSTPPTVKINIQSFEGDEVVFKIEYDPKELMQDWDFVITQGETDIIKKLTGNGNIEREIRISIPSKENQKESDDNFKIMFTFKATDIAGNKFETTGEKQLFASNKWKNFSQKNSNDKWGVIDF